MVQIPHDTLIRKLLSLILVTLASTEGIFSIGGEHSLHGDEHVTPSTTVAIRPVSSNITPVEDDRIGQLWVRDESETPKKSCTVNNLSDTFWITARHCIKTNNLESRSAYIKQYDGESVEVTSVYTKLSTDDIALIKVSEGIEADSFILPTNTLSDGSIATLVGFGGPHSYPSTASLQVVSRHTVFPIWNVPYSNIVESFSVTESWSCNGDSGGAIYSGNTIYAVHTAGGVNPFCNNRKGGKMWHTEIFPYVNWINAGINGSWE